MNHPILKERTGGEFSTFAYLHPMFRIFSRIRHTLIGSSSGRYVLYALGEIALVVLGILIALQINNWNQYRNERKEEKKLLSSIHEEFQFNLHEIDRAIEISKMIQDKCLLLLNNMGNKGIRLSRQESDSLVFTGLTRIVTYDVSNGVLEDILNSGRLHILRNDSLREKLANWQSILQDAKEGENWTAEYRNNQSFAFLRQHYSINSTFHGGINSGFDFDFRQIFKLREFENLVDHHLTLNASHERNYGIVKDYIKEILNLCSIELGKSNKL